MASRQCRCHQPRADAPSGHPPIVPSNSRERPPRGTRGFSRFRHAPGPGVGRPARRPRPLAGSICIQEGGQGPPPATSSRGSLCTERSHEPAAQRPAPRSFSPVGGAVAVPRARGLRDVTAARSSSGVSGQGWAPSVTAGAADLGVREPSRRTDQRPHGAGREAPADRFLSRWRRWHGNGQLVNRATVCTRPS